MIKANGSLTLKADAEYGRFRIKCSTGETIPVDASGVPVGQVVFTFFKLTTEGTMAAFTADRVYYELLDAEGATLYDESLNGMARLDITPDLKSNKGQVSSVNVIVYDGSNVMLANQSFGTTKPGADAEVYLLSLTEGHYLVDSDGKVDAKLAGFLYKKTGGSTVGVAGARVDIGYVNGISAYATTKSDGSWTDDDYFKGDDYTDTATCNSSPSIFARFELNGVVEAAQYVSLGQPGNDGASYEIVLDTGATVPCTAYAELKAANLIARLLKDGTPVNFDMFYVKIQDEHKTNINNYSGTHSMASYNLNTLFRQAVASGKAPYFIYTKAYVEGKVVTEKTFNVIYDTPFPFVRKETAWSAGLTFRNGDILILGANNVYMWNYPISGNSSVAPQTDVTENGTTTHWRAFDYFEMVATRILLAEYALVKNLGVEVIEMKDAGGNILFRAKDGTVTCKTGTFENVSVSGIIHSSLTYSSVKRIVGLSSYTINPQEEAFNTLFVTTNAEATCWVYLPDADAYEGLELNIYQPILTTMGLGSVRIATSNSNQYIYYSNSTALINGTIVQTVSNTLNGGRNFKIIPNMIIRLIAVNGNWYVISGALTGE